MLQATVILSSVGTKGPASAADTEPHILSILHPPALLSGLERRVGNEAAIEASVCAHAVPSGQCGVWSRCVDMCRYV